MMGSPFYPPVYESPLPAPYFGSPYAPPGSMYSPGMPNLPPQLINPASNPSPDGSANLRRAGLHCSASAPNTPGLPCTCKTTQGGTVQGVVH